MLKQLNVQIDDKVIAGSKAAADRAGMLLRRWIERALERAVEFEAEPAKPSRERTLEPFND